MFPGFNAAPGAHSGEGAASSASPSSANAAAASSSSNASSGVHPINGTNGHLPPAAQADFQQPQAFSYNFGSSGGASFMPAAYAADHLPQSRSGAHHQGHFGGMGIPASNPNPVPAHGQTQEGSWQVPGGQMNGSAKASAGLTSSAQNGAEGRIGFDGGMHPHGHAMNGFGGEAAFAAEEQVLYPAFGAQSVSSSAAMHAGAMENEGFRYHGSGLGHAGHEQYPRIDQQKPAAFSPMNQAPVGASSANGYVNGAVNSVKSEVAPNQHHLESKPAGPMMMMINGEQRAEEDEEWVVSQTSEGRRFWYSRKSRESHWYNPVIVRVGAEKIRNEEVVDQETVKHLQLFQAEKRLLKEKTEKAKRQARKEAAAQAKKAKQKAEAMKRKASEIARKKAAEKAREEKARAAAKAREEKARAAKAERARYEKERLASFAKARTLLRRYLDSIGYESNFVNEKMIEEAILYVRPTRKADTQASALEKLIKVAQVPFVSAVEEEEKITTSNYAEQKKLEQERAMHSEFFGIDESKLTPEQLAVKEEFIKFFSVQSKTKSAEQDAELTRKREERKKKLQERAAVLRATSTRPKRRGKSRLVNVDGHMILKENNYDMEEGIKTIGQAVVNTTKKIRAARSAFNFFSTEIGGQMRKDQPDMEFRDVQRQVAAMWKSIDAAGKAQYEEQAADDRIRYAREVAAAAAEEESKRKEQARVEEERRLKEEEAKAALSRSKGQEASPGPVIGDDLNELNFGDISGKNKGPPRPNYYHMIDAAVLALGARCGVTSQEIHDWLHRCVIGKLLLARFRLEYEQRSLEKAVRKALNRGDLETVESKGGAGPVVIMSISHISQLVNTKPLSMLKREEKAEKRKHKQVSATTVAQQKFQRLELERIRHNNRLRFDIFHGSKRQYAYLIRNMDKIDAFITPEIKQKIQRAGELLRIMGYSELLEKDPTGYEDWNEESKQKAEASADPGSEVSAARIKRKAISQPRDIVGGTMRPYQLEGLCWMVSTFKNGVNAILADEMGLGKTLQTISLLTHLKFEMNMCGPFLIIVPLSVLTSWANEFKKWSPKLVVIKMHSSSKLERDRLKKEVLSDFSKFDVVLTTYEMAISSNMRYVVSNKIFWRYVVIDEGHKIKNHETDLAQVVRTINCQGRLLLTGTPLQNNLHELWALLNYLYPNIFVSSEPFDQCFNLAKQMVDQDMLAKAHYLLRPFVLRRTKSEVAQRLPPKAEIEVKVGLSPMQLDWYKKLLQRDAKLLERVQASLDAGGDEGSVNDFKRLQSLMMQLRKCCNHPFLFAANAHAAAQHDLVQASGKLSLLDRLLQKLREKGHRVVIFSQFTSMLDILQEFCNSRGYKYSRLDGSTNRVQRAIDIMEYNKPNSTMFIYLMSTRAGGLGINLYTADTVVLYDSDWNPQVDLQAMDRVHRIGQKKPVHVYRLVTKDTVEERVVERAKKKLYLDKMVNRGSTSQAEKLESLSKGEMLKLLKFGASAVVETTSQKSDEISDAQLEAIIDRTKLISQMDDDNEDTSLNALDFDGTAESLSIRRLNGVDYSDPAEETKKRGIEELDDGFGKSGKRLKKSRYITTKEGYNILKANDYTLKEGEKSVYSQELRGRKKGNMFKRSGRQIAGRDFQNEGHCLVCWDGGDLLLCDQCCAAYHQHCLTPAQLPKKKASGRSVAVSWGCPHHECKVCSRKAHAAGGMLFRCTECPTAYCEDHCPFNTAKLNENGREPRFEELGQVKPAQAYFIQCSKNCQEFNRIRVSKGVVEAIKHVQARLVQESQLAKE